MRRSHQASPKWQAAGLFGPALRHPDVAALAARRVRDRSGHFSNRIENDM